MNERRREFAILRSLGARRATVFAAIVLESTAIAGLGAVLGYLVHAAILSLAFVIVRAQTGVVLDVLTVDPVLWWTPLGMLAVGVAGIIPAVKAYRTDVATPRPIVLTARRTGAANLGPISIWRA
jgi:putative ABC transport system permease protein